MCECLSYDDGSRHLCAACADELERLREQVATITKAQEITEAVCRAAHEENKALRKLLTCRGVLIGPPDGCLNWFWSGWNLEEFKTSDAAIDAAIRWIREAKP
jgi:hypothetical protein